ncbi:hypothetical protein FDG2_0386 [Candidatus Protofrankia californiensis]|uniref:Uncharacterized protein n=1 Tax=Candidatus Protofrankia californiensis TaxID=1839754 RepID=A0A1C3NTF4_9ACTN|nr:hypothetical protein FDG2_0386 [Candidatus Protofrankia californiensis]
MDLAGQTQAAGVTFRAAVADCAYGDHDTFRAELRAAGLPFVLALKPTGAAGPGPEASTPVNAARELAGGGPHDPGGLDPR